MRARTHQVNKTTVNSLEDDCPLLWRRGLKSLLQLHRSMLVKVRNDPVDESHPLAFDLLAHAKVG